MFDASQKEYIRNMADIYEVEEDLAFNLAEALGEEELFDGFPSAMADIEFFS